MSARERYCVSLSGRWFVTLDEAIAFALDWNRTLACVSIFDSVDSGRANPVAVIWRDWSNGPVVQTVEYEARVGWVRGDDGVLRMEAA